MLRPFIVYKLSKNLSIAICSEMPTPAVMLSPRMATLRFLSSIIFSLKMDNTQVFQ